MADASARRNSSAPGARSTPPRWQICCVGASRRPFGEARAARAERGKSTGGTTSASVSYTHLRAHETLMNR
eukprot:5018996-Prymnesium_polylepis.1